MPDFIAASIASVVFCLAVIALNAATALAIRFHLAPADLAENGLLQYGAALVLAHASWRRVASGRLS